MLVVDRLSCWAALNDGRAILGIEVFTISPCPDVTDLLGSLAVRTGTMPLTGWRAHGILAGSARRHASGQVTTIVVELPREIRARGAAMANEILCRWGVR